MRLPFQKDALMGLSIKNAEVERLVREAARRRGLSMTEALHAILREEAERAAVAREAEVEAKVRAVREIARRIAAMPDVSDLTDDAVLGYDADGIPSR
jgi:antitoxin VapB